MERLWLVSTWDYDFAAIRSTIFNNQNNHGATGGFFDFQASIRFKKNVKHPRYGPESIVGDERKQIARCEEKVAWIGCMDL